MKKIRIMNPQGELLNMELLFSFNVKETGKNYVAINNHNEIFENNSRYANLDLLEIIQEKSNTIYVSNIPDKEWPAVKKALQFDVFSKMPN